MASVEVVVALARPALYWSGTGGVAGIVASSVAAREEFFLEPPNDHDLPDFKIPVGFGLGVDCEVESIEDFLLACRQSSWPLKSVEDGVVEALLCLDELSVEIVLDDPLPLAKESATYPLEAPFWIISRVL